MLRRLLGMRLNPAKAIRIGNIISRATLLSLCVATHKLSSGVRDMDVRPAVSAVVQEVHGDDDPVEH